MQLLFHQFSFKNFHSLDLSYPIRYVIFLISPFFFIETVKAKEEDQVGPQTQESLRDSSTDSCPTLPYSLDSPNSSPPSPVPLVTISPERVSRLPITTSNSFRNNSAIQNLVAHDLPIPILSQTSTSALSTSTSNPYNTSPHFPFSYHSFPQVNPIIFLGIPTDYSHFRATLSGLNSASPSAASSPSHSSGFQFTSRPRPSRGRGISSGDTYSGRGNIFRGRGYRITSSTSCQTSPIPNFLRPDYQPSSTPSGDASANNALNLALMPRVFNHYPPNPPLNPFQYDFFTVLRAASPVVTFHYPSPLTQRSFSFVYSLRFTQGVDSKPLLITGVNQ